MKTISTFVFLFLITFTTHAFARSYDYYEKTVVHVLTECNSDCRKQILEDEIVHSFYTLINAILEQLQFELSHQKRKISFISKYYKTDS